MQPMPLEPEQPTTRLLTPFPSMTTPLPVAAEDDTPVLLPFRKLDPDAPNTTRKVALIALICLLVLLILATAALLVLVRTGYVKLS